MRLRTFTASLIAWSVACGGLEAPSVIAPTVEGAQSVAVVVDSGGGLRIAFFGAVGDNWSFRANDVDEIWLLYYNLPPEVLRFGDLSFDCRARTPLESYHLVVAGGDTPAAAPAPSRVVDLLATEAECDPCAPLEVVLREPLTGAPPRIARKLRDGAVISTGDGKLYSVDVEGQVSSHASIDGTRLLWTEESGVIWAMAPGYLARGTLEGGFTTLNSTGSVGRKGTSLVRDGERLYLLEEQNARGDGELHVWNETDARWHSMKSWPPSRDRWRLASSGDEVFGIGPATSRMFRVTPEGVVEEQVPNLVSRLQRIGHASELGVLISNDAGTVYVRDGPSSFRQLTDEGKLISEFVDAPGGFVATVEGSVVQYVEGHGYCEPLGLTRRDLEGIAPVGDGYVTIGDDGGASEFEIILLRPRG